MDGEGSFSVKCVVRGEDRVAQALQEALENPEYRRVLNTEPDAGVRDSDDDTQNVTDSVTCNNVLLTA